MQDFRGRDRSKADVIELDVRKLKGDTLVVFHDDRIGGQPLSTLDYTTFLELPGASEVPTLSGCLSELRGKVRLDIELKDKGSVPKVLEEIRKAAWNTDDFVITSFHPKCRREIKSDQGRRAGGAAARSNLAAAVHAWPCGRSREVVDFIAPEHGPALTWSCWKSARQVGCRSCHGR